MVESRTVYPNLWRVINLIHILLILAHWFGCFYFLLSEAEGFQVRYRSIYSNQFIPWISVHYFAKSEEVPLLANATAASGNPQFPLREFGENIAFIRPFLRHHPSSTAKGNVPYCRPSFPCKNTAALKDFS